MTEVCEAIWTELSGELIKTPQTEEEWLKKSQEFLYEWQYPFGLAAIDWKHIRVILPKIFLITLWIQIPD